METWKPFPSNVFIYQRLKAMLLIHISLGKFHSPSWDIAKSQPSHRFLERIKYLPQITNNFVKYLKRKKENLENCKKLPKKEFFKNIFWKSLGHLKLSYLSREANYIYAIFVVPFHFTQEFQAKKGKKITHLTQFYQQPSQWISVAQILNWIA